MKFEADHDAISIPVMPDSLQVSPAGERATVVVVSLNRHYVFVSRDYGNHFDRFNTPTTNFDPTDELYLSNFNPQHMVIRSKSGEVGAGSHDHTELVGGLLTAIFAAALGV